MKWNQRGHELDEIAKKYLQVRTIYIWGSGKNGTDCINFLEWLKIDTDFSIYFVDSDPAKQGMAHHGHPVLPPEELYERYDAASVVVSSNLEISEVLEEHDIPYFDLQISNCGKLLFVQHFVSVYMLYKYEKLISYWMDYNATIRCSLNCQGCLNFNNEIKHPKDESFANFKKHIDTVFQKIDLCYSVHFSGGESFLARDLPAMMRYLTNTYGTRIFDRFLITSGTVRPSEDLLAAIQEGAYWVIIDDYRDTVPIAQKRIPELTETFQKLGIRYTLPRADAWYDQEYGTDKYLSYSEEEMIVHRDTCNTFLQNCADGRFYSCCYEAYAYKAGVRDHADFIDIAQSSKKEILEYRFGYTEKGYVDMCRHCRGIGPDTKLIKPAVQIPRKYPASTAGV
ncbi:MAG: hypothetical protein K2N43_00835 [Lachnospiraceae bacterium]|nr:hypothetical protein [Lachnospiraceae bacterium]